MFFSGTKIRKRAEKRGFTQESEGERRRDKEGQGRNEEEEKKGISKKTRQGKAQGGGTAERVKRVSDDRVAAKSPLWKIAKSVSLEDSLFEEVKK